jgi:2-oxoglutarate ferredoxin oxidoreductase subunit gamma
MQLTELRVAGFGGQGVILAAMIIGKAASVIEDGYATLTQSFGPEARGSACSAQVILSSEPVLYPYITRPDIVIAMSQDAYTRFAPELKPNGVLLIEKDLVRISELSGSPKIFGIPATRLAEEIGRRLVLNIVMVGFFGAVTGLISPDALRRAVMDSVPPGTEKLNLRAFDSGYEYGLSNFSIPAIEEWDTEKTFEGA